jgi:hypothetical protein
MATRPVLPRAPSEIVTVQSPFDGTAKEAMPGTFSAASISPPLAQTQALPEGILAQIMAWLLVLIKAFAPPRLMK